MRLRIAILLTVCLAGVGFTVTAQEDFGRGRIHGIGYLSWFNTSKGSDKSDPLAGVPYDGADPRYADLYGPAGDEGMDWP